MSALPRHHAARVHVLPTRELFGKCSPAEAGSPPDEVAQPRRRRPARGFLSALNVVNRGQSEKITAPCLATADMKPELHANLIGFAIGAIVFSVTKSYRLPLPGGDDI